MGGDCGRVLGVEGMTQDEKIAALVNRCRDAERIIGILIDDLGERGPPETKAEVGSAEYEAWREDLGKWMLAMMEARAYFETYEGPSQFQFNLEDMAAA